MNLSKEICLNLRVSSGELNEYVNERIRGIVNSGVLIYL